MTRTRNGRSFNGKLPLLSCGLMLASLELGRSWSKGCDASPIAVISGGTGIVGSALVQQLAGLLPHCEIVVLTRKPEHVRLKNVTAVFADVEVPDLVLSEPVRSMLRSRATLLIHCAADTRFNLPIEQVRLTNTEGTRHILNLALECRRLEQFAHVSTLYIAGRHKGRVAEEPLQHDAGYVNTYEEAKHEAEELVLQQSARLPVGIYRLSSVIDESGNGGHFRQLVRFVPWCHQFPFFPADPCVPVDLIDREWAARALSVLIVEHFQPGCIRHICAGESSSFSVAAIMDAVFSAYGDSAVRRPRLIDLSEFECMGRRLPPTGGMSRAMAWLMTFIPHLSIAQPFDCTVTADLLARSGVPRPDVRPVLSRVLADEFRCR